MRQKFDIFHNLLLIIKYVNLFCMNRDIKFKKNIKKGIKKYGNVREFKEY
jgi:hypothetical protein